MSTVILKLAPLAPHFVPSEVQVSAARECLVRLVPDGYGHEVLVHDKPALIDPGEDLSTAACPLCGTTVNFDSEEDFEAATQWIGELCRQTAVA